jgi:hypothetical protein
MYDRFLFFYKDRNILIYLTNPLEVLASISTAESSANILAAEDQANCNTRSWLPNQGIGVD